MAEKRIAQLSLVPAGLNRKIMQSFAILAEISPQAPGGDAVFVARAVAAVAAPDNKLWGELQTSSGQRALESPLKAAMV